MSDAWPNRHPIARTMSHLDPIVMDSSLPIRTCSTRPRPPRSPPLVDCADRSQCQTRRPKPPQPVATERTQIGGPDRLRRPNPRFALDRSRSCRCIFLSNLGQICRPNPSPGAAGFASAPRPVGQGHWQSQWHSEGFSEKPIADAPTEPNDLTTSPLPTLAPICYTQTPSIRPEPCSRQPRCPPCDGRKP